MSTYTGLEIAIIGISGKFPGADNVHSFWDNLKNGVESVSFFTPEELLEEGEPKQLIKNKNYVAANAYVADKEFFDADFFGYIPDEAKIMDPQMRLFHQVCWEALEDAGCDLKDAKNKIGLFAGAAPNLNWEMYASVMNQNGLVDDFSAFQLRNSRFLASKISYAFNLKGVSMFVDTACSTSLVAVHQACRSLLIGDCNIAIAGGVTLTSKYKRGYIYEEGMINSKDGHCKAFDADSSGTVGGEGAGVVILKPLKQALKDGDNIHAIIRGTGVNNDGDNKVGYTAPSIDGQMEAIMTAQKWAKVAPETISYIEAHGTGTIMGDPIEIAALKKAFNTDKKQFCAIGSVKTNIGHLDTASGVTGLIKTVLALKNRQLPPSLHYKNPNPAIDFENSPFYVNTKLQEWKHGNTPLRAGVSSFGIGGTNAHVILEEAPVQVKTAETTAQELMLVSGKTPEALQRNIENFATYLQTNTTDTLADIAYTLKTGRTSLPYRKSFVGNDKKTIANTIATEAFFPEDIKAASNRNKIAFMFSGQGSQYQNMCFDLYKDEPIFKENVDNCLAILKEKYSKDLSEVIFSTDTATSGVINETENTQPALFIIEYALAKLVMSWGITPEIMIGHSIGEYATACISGVFTLEDALHIVVKRGELMQNMARGSMLSISITEADLTPILNEQENISLAAVNSSELCVVSGTDEAIAAFKQVMELKGYTCRDIKTSHAFHSYMMDDMLAAFESEFKNINLQKPTIPFVSNLTGEIATDEVTTATYWTHHLRGTVQFSKGIETILKTEQVVFIEVGPGKVLSYLTSTNKNKTEKHKVINLVRSIKEDTNDQAFLLGAIGKLWECGITPSWTAFYQNEQRYKVSLPTYDFEKVSYPIDVDAIELITEKFDSSFGGNHGEIDINTATWKSTLLPNTVKTSTEKSEVFLVFSGAEKFSESLVETLRNNGNSVIEVQRSAEFKVQTETSIEADFQQLSSLWKYLEASEINVQHIIYNAALSEQLETTNYVAIDATLNNGYVDICSIIKSMPKLDKAEEVKITIVNNHTTRVFTNDGLNALKTTALAPVKVIPSEMFQLRCKLVDIPYPFNNDTEKESYTQQLINELSFDTQSPLVAYRHQQRWIPTYEKFTAQEQLESSVDIVKDGFYLITGGFGGMGFSIAEDLVCNKEANVIIVHRSPFPKRSEWETLLAQEGELTRKEAATQQKIKTLLAMEAKGKTVAICQADISDEVAVQELITNVKETYPTLNGLIWAAGEVDYGGIVINRSKESLRSYCRSKIDGVLLFEKYLDFTSLDFISLFSSIGNVFYQSKFGQVAYNAANEFMEAYAAQLSEKLNIHAFAINWCDWLNVGMTIKTIQKQQETETIENINNQILHGIYPEEGVEVFYRCLKNKNKSSTILRGDIAKTMESYAAELQRRKKESTEQTLDNAELAAETFDSMEEMLTVTFKKFFGKTHIDINDDFFELGGDSLKGMTITARINQQIGSSLSIADLYKYPTIKLLDEFLSKSENQNSITKIPKASEKDQYSVSSAQRRMYYTQSLDAESTAYNETQVLQVEGILDTNQLEIALEKLVNRHESLRTNFEFVDGVIFQKVQDETNIKIEEFTTKETPVDRIVQEFVRPFNLRTDALFRFGIIQLSETKHIIMMDIHHIITDGISNNILIKDFLAFYNGEDLPALTLQYKDYAEWQQSEAEQSRILEQKQFWLQEFEGELPELELPLDSQRPLHRSGEGDSVEFSITAAETRVLKAIAETEGVSMFMLLLSLYNVFLSKLTNQKDIVVGTPTSGRMHADVEEMFGMFVNTLPIRNRLETSKTFTAFLQEVKRKTLSAIENQEFQYEDIIEALDIQPDVNRDALFDAVFAFRNFEESSEETADTIAISGLEFSHYQQNTQTAKFDLKLESSEQNDNLILAFEYRTDIFNRETIKRFATFFKNIVREVVNNQHIELGAIEVVNEADKKQLLFDFNQSQTKYPSTASIDELFVIQAAKTPKEVAVCYNDSQLTYAELESYSNQLANYLNAEYKIEKGDIVAIILERSHWLPVVTLAILKTGAAYLPLDPAYPQERIDMVQKDSNFKIAVTQDILETFLAEENLSAEKQFEVNNAANDLAYIMYTSGSTGIPKAVMIPHRSVVRLVKSTNYYEFAATDKLISTGAFSFDATTFEYWGMLLNGGELILCDQDVLLNNNALYDQISNRGVNVMWFTAGWGNQLIDDTIEIFENLDTVLLGGEKLSPKHIQKLRTKYPELQIINGYGPTENTTFSLTYDIKEITGNIPIGKPISNSTAYILDECQKLQPVGVVGEIYLGGDGLAKGYLNDPIKTAEKFIENPYKKGEKIYKSGDLGMWLPDGNIRYMGRNDNQVKIRGHRIEPGEIEQVLQKQATVAQAAVTIKEFDGDKAIVAYLRPEGASINKEVLKEELKQVLPDYMIPNYYVEVSEMPLNTNGKVDYKALPELQKADMIRTEFVEATTETEVALVEIWQKLLQLEKIGIKDNFFDIGGHSIKAIKLSHDISTKFDLDISIKNIFVYPTIEQLAAQIEIAQKQQEVITSNTELNEIEI